MSREQCPVPDCASPSKEQGGLCSMHDAWWYLRGDVGDLLCTCNSPLADPAINFGQCPQCKRKPLALMKVRP